MHDAHRAKRVAARKMLSDTDRMEAHRKAWQCAREMLVDALELSFRKCAYRILMFPDVDNLFRGCCLTQVPPTELLSRMPVMGMAHKPLAFLSGSFKGSQLNWATVDMEGLAIACGFRRLDYVFRGGASICCDLGNLCCIFSPEACVAKKTVQRHDAALAELGAFLRQFPYHIQHIPGVRNHWGNLRSRWLSVDANANNDGLSPPARVRAVAVFTQTGEDYSVK